MFINLFYEVYITKKPFLRRLVQNLHKFGVSDNMVNKTEFQTKTKDFLTMFCKRFR